MSTSDSPAEIAAELGLVVVEPGPQELLLDMDDAEAHEALAAALKLLTDNGELVIETKRTVSKSGNAHVYLTLPKWAALDPMTRIALQACLGSDRKRELYSILRVIRAYDIPPTVLFERPEAIAQDQARSESERIPPARPLC